MYCTSLSWIYNFEHYESIFHRARMEVFRSRKHPLMLRPNTFFSTTFLSFPSILLVSRGLVTCREGQKFIRVVPVDPQFPCIEVPADSFAPEVHPNALVLVSLPENPWPISAPVPQGSIVEVRKATLQAEYDLILHELGMHSDFPEAVAQVGPLFRQDRLRSPLVLVVFFLSIPFKHEPRVKGQFWNATSLQL